MLTVIDDFNHKFLVAVVDISIGGARVARELDGIAELRGYANRSKEGQNLTRVTR